MAQLETLNDLIMCLLLSSSFFDKNIKKAVYYRSCFYQKQILMIDKCQSKKQR